VETASARSRAFIRSPILYILAIFLVLPGVFPLIGGYTDLGTEIMIMSLFALSYNMLLGHTGLMSFGHGSYFGLGAYCLGLTQVYFSSNVWLALLFGMLGGGLAAFLIGLVIIRKSGIYFGLLTVAFTQMFFTIAFRWREVTGGEDGLTFVPFSWGPLDLKAPLTLYYFVFVFFSISMIVFYRITRSPVGRVLRANKYNRDRAMVLGYNIYRYRLFAYVLSGLFSGLAGALSGVRIAAAFAEPMTWLASGDVVMMVILGGGLVNFFGPVLGAAIFTILQDLISTITIHWMFIFGIMFVLVILVMPEGILGFFSKDLRVFQGFRRRMMKSLGMRAD
jgi:ABC-type branched-subunit amino acid transport system permease subunit